MPKNPRGTSKFSEATRERAVRLVLENTEAFGSESAAGR
jgi:transposase-like protein